MMSKEELITFMDWVSKNYIPDNGIGYWVPSDYSHGDAITSEELLILYLEQRHG